MLPYLGDLLTMVPNHLLTGMILQVVVVNYEPPVSCSFKEMLQTRKNASSKNRACFLECPIIRLQVEHHF